MQKDVLSDEELIEQYRDGDGDETVITTILNRYKNLVRKKASSMYILGGDREDLIQEGMIGLVKAFREYDSGRDASFATFADLCVSRQLFTAVEASGRKKHMPLNTYISLYSQPTDSDGTEMGATLEETLPGDSDSEPEKHVLDQELVEEFYQIIDRELSKFERQVLDLHLTGMGYGEIAKVLGRDEKSTDNALQRIRMKLRKFLK